MSGIGRRRQERLDGTSGQRRCQQPSGRPYLIVRTATAPADTCYPHRLFGQPPVHRPFGSTYRRREPSDTATGYTCETSSTNGSHSIPLIPPGLDPPATATMLAPVARHCPAGRIAPDKEVGRRIRLSPFALAKRSRCSTSCKSRHTGQTGIAAIPVRPDGGTDGPNRSNSMIGQDGQRSWTIHIRKDNLKFSWRT